MANPTPDHAIDECFDELKDAARPRAVDQHGLDTLRKQHRQSFKDCFIKDPEAWKRDGAIVRRMSWYTGIFARFFAETAGSRHIKEEHLIEARDVVSSKCSAFLDSIQAKRSRIKKMDLNMFFKYCP